MKKLIAYIFGALLLGTLLFSCSYPVSQQMGQDDVAYLVIVSSSDQKYKQPVQVTVNDNTQFLAEVVKNKHAHNKGMRYQVSSGMKKVTVSQNGKVLTTQEFLLSAQQTKMVYIP